MKVRELIKVLENHNPDKEVIISKRGSYVPAWVSIEGLTSLNLRKDSNDVEYREARDDEETDEIECVELW